MPSNESKRIIPYRLLAFLACIAFVSVYSCSGPDQTDKSLSSDNKTVTPNLQAIPAATVRTVTLSAEEERAIGLQTEAAQSRPVSNELTAMGKVLANQYRQAIVSYPFPARVSEILARTGDFVRKGQPLIVLQSEEVGEATSAFYKCQADLELAKVCFEREQRLFERGVGAKKDFLTAEAELKVAEASVNAAEKKLHVLGFSEEEVRRIAETHQVLPLITLYAPISGKIISGNMVLGSMVDETKEILTIMDPSLLWVEAEIYEKDIARIKAGMEAVIHVQAYPEETFPGKIVYISDLLNESTRTVTIRTEVSNSAGKLKPGMFASLVVVLEQSNMAVTVPTRALLDDRGQKLVFIRDGNRYSLRQVQTGPKHLDHIVISEGVSEGEVVVTSGTFQLKSKLQEEVLKTGIQ